MPDFHPAPVNSAPETAQRSRLHSSVFIAFFIFSASHGAKIAVAGRINENLGGYGKKPALGRTDRMCNCPVFHHDINQRGVEKKINVCILREPVVNTFQHLRVVDETADLFGMFSTHHFHPGAVFFPQPVIDLFPKTG